MKNPYHIIKSQHVTEKTAMLQQLQHSTSNRSIAKCKNPKYVFLVDKQANKYEIAEAVQRIYSANNIKVVAVNTINVKPKPRRAKRGRAGMTASIKKAIVTLEVGDSLESQ